MLSAKCQMLRVPNANIFAMPDSVGDPLVRFSDRAEDYAKYRPRYSHDVVDALQQACGLTAQRLIADIGCGTGLLAEIFLNNGNRVIGVEPNREMRLAGEQCMAGSANFSIDSPRKRWATAELCPNIGPSSALYATSR